ncbi:hypothetical protein ES703_28292 [subsurface metagenome]
MLDNKQKAIHTFIPMGGAITPYLLTEFADTAVERYLMEKGAITHPAQVHHLQRPSAVVPLAVGIPLLLAAVFNVVKDPAKQLMMLEFAAPLLVGGGVSIARHARLQASYTAAAAYQPQYQPQYQPGGAPPGAIQVGAQQFYRQAPYMTRGGAPRPTYGNR